MATVLAVLLAGPLDGLTAARFSWLASVAFAIGTLLAARHITRRLPDRAPARRFWWAVGAYAVASAIGYLYQLAAAQDPGDLLVGPVTISLVGAGTALLVTVMCTYPLGTRTAGERLRLWLDMATVMVGASAFGWYLAAPTGGGDVWHEMLAIATGPVVMLVAVFAVAKLLIGGRPPFSTWTGVLGACAAAIGGLTGLLGGALLARGHADWLLALSALGDACMMLAATAQRRQVDANPDALQRPRRRPYSVLPYVAVAAVYGLLLVVAAVTEHLGTRTWPVLVSGAVSTGLVIIRQLTAFADNDRLLADLRVALRERDTLTRRLHDMAFQDSLTGLANRALFHDRLDAALARARRSGATVAVMLLDLDDFKPVNDRNGHAAGDAVLRETAARLRVCLRETDTIARLGGDEFAVVLENPVPDSVPTIAARIVETVAQPVQHGGETLQVGASLGVAVDDGGQRDGDHLLRDADAAMYAAKNGGKNSFATYPVLV